MLTPQHPTNRRHSPKPSHRPAKTINIAPKTVLTASIHPHNSFPRPTHTTGNERK